MKLVYIAGPYSADTAYEVKKNILAAEHASMCIMEAGNDLFPVVPHKNTEFMEGVRNGQYFIDGTKELMRRCDAVFIHPFLPPHESIGTQGEITEAKKLDIPLFFNFEDLYDWAEGDEIKSTLLERFRKLFGEKTYV